MSSIIMPQEYINEMNGISMDLNNSKYEGYKAIASNLGQFMTQDVVAAIIGCVIPESGTNHRVLNASEYSHGGKNHKSDVLGWNCGEGLIQWTHWKNKLNWIKKYNADSRSTEKLPTSWEVYKQGEPETVGGKLCGKLDGKHISGISLKNQMLLLSIYYSDLAEKCKTEQNLAVIVARIYQQKAGTGYYSNVSNPIQQAYLTAKNYYSQSGVNTFLKSLKAAQQYLNSPITPGADYPEYTSSGTSGTSSGTGTTACLGASGSSSGYTNGNGVFTGSAWGTPIDGGTANNLYTINPERHGNQEGVVLGTHLIQR